TFNGEELKNNKHYIKRKKSYEKIMESALQVFSKKGYSDTSVEEIAESAGYTKGTVYVHFKSKEELFLTLMDERLKAFKRQMIDRGIDEKGEGSIHSVKELLHLFIELTEKDYWTPIFFEFCAISLRNEKIKGKLLDHYEKWLQLIMAYLAGLKQSGKIDNGIDIRKTSYEILIALDGFHWHKTIHSNEVDLQMVENSVFSLLRLPLKEE
ncbi:TetR/AcrR family transcriptional regulator, partial [Brevibacillus agri]|nr:TetR/AcrR family transcriptional regulator [Brevibacillus agri]MED1657880.1 TetR/AcrR family transcriptional regulator [Brevibacillus agri]MED1690279.1 TetR/AcrR family transcriptional regulator [Brevibacillus agri]MED1695586.1 TetR/AcrR family transcriptional regulator [Brevibacillus agri]MED1700410.1 TetR/AcrR family transcriptional regulator [Brevibacillus agri]